MPSMAAQGVISGALALAVLASAAAVTLASGSERVAAWIDSRRNEHATRENSLYVQQGCFVDLGSRILLHDIPRADFSRGGVHFFGSSALASFLETWELPSAQRALVGNFGMGGATHVDQLHLVRYLVEREGLLAAGGERVMVVLCLFYGNAADAERSRGLFENVCERYGLYEYDLVAGLQPLELGRAERCLRTQRALCANFLRTCRRLRLTGDLRLDVEPLFEAQAHRPDFYREQWRSIMGPDWRAAMVEQVETVGKTFAYLRERGVETRAVLLPSPSWHRESPFAAAYGELVRDLCRREGVPWTDLEKLLADDEFADNAHATPAGARKAHAALMEIALEFLRRTGALAPPEDES